MGATLAFNTLGWIPQNVLFSTLDALLGDSLLAGAFGGENPSDATASIVDSVIDASGPEPAHAGAAIIHRMSEHDAVIDTQEHFCVVPQRVLPREDQVEEGTQVIRLVAVESWLVTHLHVDVEVVVAGPGGHLVLLDPWPL